MRCLVLSMLAFLSVLLAQAQNEDMPSCGISKSDIVKNKIGVIVKETKNYKWGIYRNAYSWRIIYTFDVWGNIVMAEWVSLKTGKSDHTNQYTYDSHGNLTSTKIVGNHLDVANNYFFRYNQSGRIDQYWTKPHTKLLFSYNEDGLLVYKLEVSPTDTSLEWKYAYENKQLIAEEHTIRALPTPFITTYTYHHHKVVLEVKTHGLDTISKTTYRYNESGKPVEKIEISRGGRRLENWFYNASGQLMKFVKKSETDVEITEYLYNTAGLLVSTKKRASFIPGVVEKSIFYYPYTKK